MLQLINRCSAVLLLLMTNLDTTGDLLLPIIRYCK
jgi:hypothetical protein